MSETRCVTCSKVQPMQHNFQGRGLHLGHPNPSFRDELINRTEDDQR